ncbi:MAG: endolytic transglycosylase MltG [Pseudolabrys sp.]|nr:endolytic transglycosylase MltG [Pseudolabrys sp.]
MNSNFPPNGGTPVPPPPDAQPPASKPPRSPRALLEPERVPAPVRRSRHVRHPVVMVGNAIFTFLVLVALVAGGGLYYGKQKFEEPGPLTEDKVVNISNGLGIKEISDVLMREGVIDSPWVFMGGAKVRGSLKYGEYQFTKNASLSDVVDTMIEGKVVQHNFTVAEGLTSEQIVQRLLETTALTGQIREIPREGTLLPETYKFTLGMERGTIIQRMQQAHKRVLQEAWSHRSPDLPLTTPEQLVTLASIVEKETGKPDERTRVAAVFVNRLKTKMRLQSDPTIIYGLTGGKGALGRPIQRNEIDQPTPYNTYVIDGLPPGPIANPGKASLEATATPARTKELYFVADGTGGHAFTENYADHQKYVARLRAIERGEPPPVEPPPAARRTTTPATTPTAPRR